MQSMTVGGFGVTGTQVRRGTRGFVAAVLAVFVAIVFAGQAGAASGDMVMRGFMKSDGTIIVTEEVDAGSDSSAKLMVQMLDSAALEDAFDGVVVQEKAITGTGLSGLGADSGTLYAVVFSNGGTGLIVVASEGSSVFIIVTQSMGQIDGAAFATISADIIDKGVEDMSVPTGYTEVEMDDSGVGL